jgi:hypothetical protein
MSVDFFSLAEISGTQADLAFSESVLRSKNGSKAALLKCRRVRVLCSRIPCLAGICMEYFGCVGPVEFERSQKTAIRRLFSMICKISRTAAISPLPKGETLVNERLFHAIHRPTTQARLSGRP